MKKERVQNGETEKKWVFIMKQKVPGARRGLREHRAPVPERQASK